MIQLSKETLLEKMVAAGRLTSKQLIELKGQALAGKKSIFQVAVDAGVLKDEEVTDILSEEYGIPVINLQALKISKELVKSIPARLIERYQIIPVSRIGKLLTVAASNPFDLMMRDDLKGITQCEVSLVLAPSRAITAAIDAHATESANIHQIIEEIDDESLQIVKDEKGAAEDKPIGRDSAEEAPVVRMVNLILEGALRSRASDIHFEPYEHEFRIRYRIDGALRESFSHSREMYPSLVARMKIISQLDITEKRVPQDGRFRLKMEQREVDFRVSILPTYYGEKIVLRVLDKAGLKSGLDKLGFTEKPTAVIAEAIKSPYGMMLVTGPTGSGKSTSLYTILGTLNTPDRNIMTIEDPVEYQVEGITQTQVIPEVGLNFASGLRSLLRQSPDIVLVGEIRDGETADIAVKAALTGHLVFSTLHTNSAPGAVTRLIDMGVEPFLIASSLVCVAAQRLMKRICPFCKKPYRVPEDVLRRCGMTESDLEGLTAYHGSGCAKCNQTGYYGRLGAIEVMKVDGEIRQLIIQRKSSRIIQDAAIRKGMETLYENAFSLFKQGLTTLEEVLRVSSAER